MVTVSASRVLQKQAPDLLFVLAGNAEQAHDWQRTHNIPSIRYVMDLTNLLGFYEQYYIRVGTWFDRVDIDAIENYLRERGFVEVGDPTWN
jgi:hypothetical protein